MFGMIAHALTSEYGTGAKGENGNQNGHELCCSQWYSFPWLFVIRPISASSAERIADFMEKAVANGNIGYANTNHFESGKRNGLFYELQNVDFKPEEIKNPCACDCSSLVYCAIYNVTRTKFISNDSWSGLCPMVRHMEYYLLTTCDGFEKVTDADINTNSALLMRGDILVADDHVAVWV
jgi:hypothetical protein